MKRGVIYCRKSTDGQKEATLEDQAEHGRDYCAAHGIHVVEVVNESHTGAELDGRPQLSRIRQMVRAGKVDVMVIWKWDRLTRDMGHLALLVYEFAQAGAAIECIKEPFENNLEGSLLRTVMGYVAEREHKAIRERTAMGRHARVKRGVPLFTAASLYGYDFNADRTAYEVNPETANVVRRIFEMAAEGETLYGICKALNDDNVPTPHKGRGWLARTIRRILDNPAYYGEAVGLRWESEKVVGKNGRAYYLSKPRAPEEAVALPEGTIPAIVTKELATKAREKIRGRGRVSIRSHPMSLLRSFVYCENCGVQMDANHVQGRLYYTCRASAYRSGPACHNNISGRFVDEVVWRGVCERIEDREGVLAAMAEQRDAANQELQTISGALTEAQQEQTVFLKKYATVTDPTIQALLANQLAKTDETVKRLEALRQAKLQDTVEKSVAWKMAEISLINMRAAIGLEAVEDVASKRQLLSAIGLRVVIQPGKGTTGRVAATIHPGGELYEIVFEDEKEEYNKWHRERAALLGKKPFQLPDTPIPDGSLSNVPTS